MKREQLSIRHNGSGKSTTVRLIDGYWKQNPRDCIDGHGWLRKMEYTSSNRYVFQNPDNQRWATTRWCCFGLENQNFRQEMKKRGGSLIMACWTLKRASVHQAKATWPLCCSPKTSDSNLRWGNEYGSWGRENDDSKGIEKTMIRSSHYPWSGRSCQEDVLGHEKGVNQQSKRTFSKWFRSNLD